MTDRFIYHGGDGSAGTVFAPGLAGAYASWALAIAASVAGDRYIFAHDHLTTLGGTTTFTVPGTIGSPCSYGCVDRTTGLDASANVGARAKILTTAGNILIDGCVRGEGLDITSNAGGIQLQTTTNKEMHFRRTTFTTGTVLNSRMTIGANGGRIIFEEDVTHVGQNANCYPSIGAAVFEWRNSPTPYSGTIPTNLFYSANSPGSRVLYDGCDLTMFSTKVLLAASGSFLGTINNCGLPTTYTITAQVVPQMQLEISNCSKPDGTLVNERYLGQLGVVAVEGIVYRTGGATDGVDSYSLKMASSANSNRHFALPSYDIQFDIDEDQVGVPQLATVYLATDNVTLVANDAWAEVYFLGNALTLDSSLATTGPTSVLGNGTAPVADASAWTSTGIGTLITQKIAVPFTPLRAGPHRVRVLNAKASTTIWVDFQVVVTPA